MRAPAKPSIRARHLHRDMTLPETQLWTLLRRNGTGARFRRQYPIGPYVLDFYAPDVKVAVEVDGTVHDIASVERRDIRRDAWLTEQGIRVLRFNATDVLRPSSREMVFDTILAIVASLA